MPLFVECNEKVVGFKDTEYRGCQNVTQTGKTCLAWDLHESIQEQYPDSGLVQNFCRNPDAGQHGSMWCYTDRINERYPSWDNCDPVGFTENIESHG